MRTRKGNRPIENPPQGGVVVAVSGGADSTALSIVLADAGVGPLTLAHVRHGFRPDAAAHELAQLRELSLRVAAPLELLESAPPSGWRLGDKIPEAWARERRYGELVALARRIGAATVATAHHAGDRRETQLLHVLRGGGLRALAGMAKRRDVGGVTLWRPLLDREPEELRALLRAHGVGWIEDASNADLRLARNRVRHRLLPELHRRDDPFLARADSIARLARRALDRIAVVIDRLFESAVEPPVRERRLLLPFETARRAGAALVRELLEGAARRVVPTAFLRARRRELEELARWLLLPRSRGRRSLGSLDVERSRGWIAFRPAGAEPEPAPLSRARRR